ncbi:hypothetical protein ACP70R_032563 [Stipagrostis hirtigluma subsp. patula]
MADRSWMLLENRLCSEFLDGVKSFIAAAEADMLHQNKTAMCCPCIDCRNDKRFSKSMYLHAHLVMRGFMRNYFCWNKHGEDGINEGELDRESQACNTDHIRSRGNQGDPRSDVNILGFGEDYADMADNVEDMVHDGERDDFTDGEFAKFQRLVQDSKTPLYHGSEEKVGNFTRLSSVLKLFKLKARYCWSDKSFTELLVLLREMLPADNKLPGDTYEAKQVICPLGLEVERIHACKNDCCLFRGDYADLENCPVCGTSRYKRQKDGGDGEGANRRRGAPRKVVWYLPIIPRLKRLFANEKEAKLLRWHKEGRKNDGMLRHPADGSQWRNIDMQFEWFSADVRNLRFALSTDGMNPFGDRSTSHSTWPVVMSIYNLPGWLCNKKKYIMMCILISGPKQPGNDIDVYLRPLVDDLKKLWITGVEVYDSYKREYFELHGLLLCTVTDLPGGRSLSGQSKGEKECPQCGDDTASVLLPKSGKRVFMRHRRFLPKQLSVTGVREHDILTEALGNPEHRGRVRGVSSDSGWRSWPECEDMYRKRKKKRVVDVEMLEEMLEQRLAREREQMHQQFMALLAAHGVATIPQISPLERRSSQSSVGLHELHAQASALHLPDGDTIDGLDEPTPCILQIVRGDVRYNVARGQVFPDETVLHTAEVDRRFHAVVMVDWVDDEYCDQPLPIPNDEIPTLRDALWQRILWDRLHIICRKSELPPPPQRQISRVPSPPSQNKKEKQKEEEKEEKKKENEKEREKGQKEKEKEKDKEKEKKEQGKEKEKEEKEKGKGKEKEKGKTRKDSKKSNKSKSNEVAPVWTSANPNFKMGEPILPQDELRALGGQAYALHQYYMKCCEEKKRNSITLCVSKDEFRKGGIDYVCVNFSDLYDLYHHSGMDISLLRVHTLSLIKQSKMDKLPVGFLDPSAMSTSQLNAGGSDVFDYLVKALSHFIATKKHYVMFAYNTISKEGSSHWVLVVIVLPLKQVWYLDSLRHVKRDYTNLGKVIDQAFAKVQFHHKMKKQQLTHVTDFECHQQQANDACGFYCCHHMSSIMQQSDKKKPEEIKFTSAPLTSGDLNIVTHEVAICLTVDTLPTRGDFHCPVN